MSEVKKLNFNETEVKKILGGSIRIFFTKDTVGSKTCMFVMGDFEPGEGLDPHAHDEPPQDEVYYCVSGTGTVWYGDDEKETLIGPGDALWIPKGTKHYIRNTGKEKLIMAFFLAPGR